MLDLRQEKVVKGSRILAHSIHENENENRNKKWKARSYFRPILISPSRFFLSKQTSAQSISMPCSKAWRTRRQRERERKKGHNTRCGYASPIRHSAVIGRILALFRGSSWAPCSTLVQMFMHEEVERPRQQVSALMLAKAQKARRKGMEQTGLDMRPFVIHYFHFSTYGEGHWRSLLV